MAELCYYIDDYTDEVMPCHPSLEAWAEWLSKPDPEWHRYLAADDGQEFQASVLRFDEDIIATREGDEWTFSREPDGVALLAPRFGAGLGYDAETICGDFDELRALLDDNDADENSELIAVAFDEPSVIVRYTLESGIPTLTVVRTIEKATVQ